MHVNNQHANVAFRPRTDTPPIPNNRKLGLAQLSCDYYVISESHGDTATENSMADCHQLVCILAVIVV